MRSRIITGVAAIAGAALLMAGCSSSPATPTAGTDEKITLTVATFNEFGYEELFEEYMADNPNIRDVDEGLVKFNASEVKRTRSEKAGRASAVQAAMTPEAIAATAKKHSMSEVQVQNMLRAKGLIK